MSGGRPTVPEQADLKTLLLGHDTSVRALVIKGMAVAGLIASCVCVAVEMDQPPAPQPVIAQK